MRSPQRASGPPAARGTRRPDRARQSVAALAHVPPPPMLPLPRRLRLPRGVRDDKIAHLLENPREIVLFDREAIEVRRGVEPIDRVELTIADRELDRVHVVPKRVSETDRVQDRPRAQFAFDRTTDDIALVERRRRVIADRKNILPTDGDAADVVLPLDELLKDHRLGPVSR